MKLRTTIAGVSLCLAGACAPPEIIPSAPPGIEISPPELREEDQAEAKGEGAMQGQAPPRTDSLQVANNPPTAAGIFGFADGLKYTTLKPGTGQTAKTGDKVTIHYVATLMDGKEFDNSRKSGNSHTFVLGSVDVLRGWNEGIAGMKVGELRKLTLSPQLAFGSQGNDRVPPSATVEYEVELLRVGG